MTRTEIESIARRHEVDESHIKGRTKEELLRSIDRWFSRLADHAIIANMAGSKSDEYKKWIDKRDALRKDLNGKETSSS